MIISPELDGIGGTKKRPFHETLMDAIRAGDVGDVPVLYFLICTTEIPKGHGSIIMAIEETYKDDEFWKDLLLKMKGILLEGQRLAEEKELAKAQELREEATVI